VCHGLGTFLGWSVLLNLIGWSDHLKYFVVAGGDDIANFTCLDILFCSFFWTSGLAGSLQICTPLILDVLQDVAFDILGLCLYLLDVLLGLTPERLVTLGMFCSLSFGD
jgi:hypothetical protein